MKVFVDTSALLALMDASDQQHAQASICWHALLKEELHTTNYVLVETIALLQNRLGLTLVQPLLTLLSIVEVGWVSEELHQAGIARLLQEARRRLSLVDCVSFEYMLREQITVAFTFDKHFAEAGFQQYAPPTHTSR